MEKIDYTRHYRHWHSDDFSHAAHMVSFYNTWIALYFPTDKDQSILDIGCGMGFLLLALKDSGYQNTKGIDIDEGQVRSCQNKALCVELVEDTIAYLLAHPANYDVITAFDTLEHIPPDSQINFLEAVHAALKPSGRFLCTVPNASSILGLRNRYIDYTHHVVFTEISLDFILYNAGFRNITIQPMDFIHFSAHPLKFLHWLLLASVRFLRRMSFIAELGFTQGRAVPLSFNLIAKVIKSEVS